MFLFEHKNPNTMASFSLWDKITNSLFAATTPGQLALTVYLLMEYNCGTVPYYSPNVCRWISRFDCWWS